MKTVPAFCLALCLLSLASSVAAQAPHCEQTATVDVAAAATTQIVALLGGQRIYVCGWHVNVIGAAGPPTIKFVHGTGTACATGIADLTPVHSGSTTAGDIVQWTFGGPDGAVIRTSVGSALCVTSTSTSPQRGIVLFTRAP